jgi:hypothetical protein
MPLRATSPLARSDRHAYTAGLPGRTKNLIKKRVHRRLMAILAADVGLTAAAVARDHSNLRLPREPSLRSG